MAGLSQYPILAQLVEEILDYLDNLPAEYSYAQRLAEIERRVKYIENLPDTIVGQAKGKLEEAEKIVIEAPRKIYENPEATEWFSGEAATAEKKADDLREQLKMAQVTAAILRQILPVAPDENLSQVAPSPEQEIFQQETDKVRMDIERAIALGIPGLLEQAQDIYYGSNGLHPWKSTLKGAQPEKLQKLAGHLADGEVQVLADLAGFGF